MEAASVSHPEKRRRGELCNDGSGDAGVSVGDMEAAGNCLCDGRTAAVAFPANFRGFPAVASGGARGSWHMVWFGSILGDDGKPFKTRSGETVKLRDLLDEAEERALKVVNEKASEREVKELPPERAKEIARVIGLGAIKYADLSPNRRKVIMFFSWDKMLALNGNHSALRAICLCKDTEHFCEGGVERGSQKSEVRSRR